MLEAHMTHQEMQQLGIKNSLEDREKKCNDRHKDNILWMAGILDMTLKAQAKARVDKTPQALKGRKKHIDETARQDSGGLTALQPASATQDGEPDKL